MDEDKNETRKLVDVFPELAAKVARSLKVKKNEIPLVRKFMGFERDVEVQKDKKGQDIVVSYISTKAIDRDKEVLMPEGVDLENYKKNPVVLWSHDYHSVPIGKNLWIKPDTKGLKAATLFANTERGQEIFRAYTEDMAGTGPLLKGFSVGFIPKKWKDKDEIIAEAEKAGESVDKAALPERIYTEWELLEYSPVPIPSCPEALTEAEKSGVISHEFAKSFEPVTVQIEEVTEEEEPEEEEIEKETEVLPYTTYTDDTLVELKESIVGLRDEISEIKEGRILSTKNRTLIINIVTNMEMLTGEMKELLEATEPKPKDDVEVDEEIVTEQSPPYVVKIKEKVTSAPPKTIEEILTSEKIQSVIQQSVKDALAKKRGKIE